MCDRITLDELLADDPLDYVEYTRGFYRDGEWHRPVPTGRRIPSAAGERLLQFIRTHLNEETSN